MDHLRSVASSLTSYVTGAESEDMKAAKPVIPQTKPLTDDQVQNNAGGFGWKVDDMDRLRRFMCLGSEGGTYYVRQKELGLENAQCVTRLIAAGKGQDVVNEVVRFSVEGRTAKQDSIIFVLAICARQEEDVATKQLAYEKLSDVCRIPTHLFMFVDLAEKLSKGTGWGRAHRKAIGKWYLRFDEDPYRLAVHVTKYKNRNGWEHRDVLRLAHPKPKSDDVGAVLRYVIKGLDASKKDYLKEETSDKLKKVFEFLEAVEDIKKAPHADDVAYMIRRHKLVREHVPTQFLNCVEVWRALIQKMPMTAMIRNLSKMTTIGLLENGTDESKLICDKLVDAEVLRAAKIHPFNVLVALNQYRQGRGDKGKLTWKPNQAICNALDTAFYKSFKFVEPTEKRYCLAIDVSGSMCVQVLGSPITANVAAAAMAMVTARTEKNFEVVAFSTHLKTLPIKSTLKLEEVAKITANCPMGGTDCAQPMIWAKKQNKKFDVFIVYTDCETWAGQIHPAEALRNYRRHAGIWNAKLIVCGMSSGGFTIADPEDPGMLDMAGFDSAAPEIMRNFIMESL